MTLNQLEQYRDLSKEVKMLERRIADLESRPEVFVSDSVVGSSPCIPYQPHTIAIKGYGNQYQDKINALRLFYHISAVNQSFFGSHIFSIGPPQSGEQLRKRPRPVPPC